MRILVNTPSLKLLGGVANHYEGLRFFWTKNVKYNTVGKRSNKQGSGKYWFPWDLLKFVFRLFVFRPDVVLLNPSLGVSALKRDFIFLNLACCLGFKVVLMIHGFDWKYVKIANWEWISRNLNKTDGIIVLAQAFKDELIHRGIKKNIFLSTTKVTDSMLDGFDISNRSGEVKHLLFLSRIEKAKGVYEAVETFALLKSKHKELTFTFVGDGSELVALKRYVEKKTVLDVRFTGALNGESLKNEFKRADFFFFTSYGEGMPTAVLEAMAFGLPIMTRRVGGLCDFFEDGKMGRITDSMNPLEYAQMVEPFLESATLTKKVSLYNHSYARANFMASKVARNIENILKMVI